MRYLFLAVVGLCLWASAFAPSAPAQSKTGPPSSGKGSTAPANPAPSPAGPLPTPAGKGAGVSVGFRNDTKTPVMVQGATVVNGTVRRGSPLVINPGKTVWDSNLSSGPRVYNVYDANQPTRVLVRDQSITVGTRDLLYSIRPPTAGSSQAQINAETMP